jgi:hypothetical protein
MIASTIGTLPMWCDLGHQALIFLVNTSKVLACDALTSIVRLTGAGVIFFVIAPSLSRQAARCSASGEGVAFMLARSFTRPSHANSGLPRKIAAPSGVAAM